MTLIRHEGQLQVTCDACPLTYRRTYAEEDLMILVEDIKAEGWKIERQAPSGATRVPTAPSGQHAG